MLKRLSLFWAVIITIVAVYLFLLFGVPYISMLIVGASRPLPIPSALMGIYLMLILTGVFVYLAADDERLNEFFKPVQTLLRGRDTVTSRGDRAFGIARWAVLGVVPLLLGWVMYRQTAPSSSPPTALRIQHPTIPFEYEQLTNPFRNADGTVAADVIDEGRELFQKNCRPCHGTPANGAGPMAYGFRLRPANFGTEDTIATIIEAYAFWRIKEGGISLPTTGSPWDSAMPAWKDELTDDQIWKIIAAEYQIAGVEPRRPESHGE